jgi:hypothetical protein
MMNIPTSGRKTCVVGFGVSILSTIELVDKILFREADQVYKFYVHNTHQNFVKHFFGKIRLKGGFNYNPSAVEVKFIISQLLYLDKEECTIILESVELLEPEEEE